MSLSLLFLWPASLHRTRLPCHFPSTWCLLACNDNNNNFFSCHRLIVARQNCRRSRPSPSIRLATASDLCITLHTSSCQFLCAHRHRGRVIVSRIPTACSQGYMVCPFFSSYPSPALDHLPALRRRLLYLVKQLDPCMLRPASRLRRAQAAFHLARCTPHLPDSVLS